jgi:hypothetical protein
MALPGGDTKGWGATVLTVTTTRQLIPLSQHARVQVLRNTSTTVTVYMGGVDITSANATTDAYPLLPGESFAMATSAGGDAMVVGLYVVTAASTATLAVLRGDV